MAKKITLEKLAHMIQRGFADTASQKEMDARFKSVDERLDSVNDRLDSLAEILRLMQEEGKRFRESTEAEIMDLWEHMRRLERKVGLRR